MRLLRRRRPDPAGRTAPQPATLTPVFVRMISGRVGSSMTMQLLGTSDEIAFWRRHPFEKRRAATLLAWAHSLREPLAWPSRDADWMNDDELWWIDPDKYHVRVDGDPLHHGPKGERRVQLSRAALRGLWQAFSDSERAQQPGARWYAEKYAGFGDDLLDAGIPVRFLDLVRDPRDIWASILAFDAQRGYSGFGRPKDASDEEYLRTFADGLARRIASLRDTPSQAKRLLVRYEDLATNLPEQAARIGRWLDVSLDATAVTKARDSHRNHMTSPDLASSVGRWHREVSTEQQQLLAEALGPMDDFGYDLGAAAAAAGPDPVRSGTDLRS
jgi:hypothetical protein